MTETNRQTGVGIPIPTTHRMMLGLPRDIVMTGADIVSCVHLAILRIGVDILIPPIVKDTTTEVITMIVITIIEVITLIMEGIMIEVTTLISIMPGMKIEVDQ